MKPALSLSSEMTRKEFLTSMSAFGVSALCLALASRLRLAVSADVAQSGASVNQLTSEITAMMPGLLSRTRVPGISMALIRDAEVVWSKGFGVRSVQSKEPVDSDTIFEAASLSKPAFAYVALKLVDERKLDLDKPLSEYIPEPPLIPGEPRLKQVTARRCLSHSSGLPLGRSRGETMKLRFDPGAKFAYSPAGIEYVRRAVEQITGRQLSELMKSNLIDPFTMSNSSFGWVDGMEKNYASGHAKNGMKELSGNGRWVESSEAEKETTRRDYPYYRYPTASAGLYTTASDFARFMIEVMKSHGNSDRFAVSDATISEMLRTQVPIKGPVSWGLGWGLESTALGDGFWHWGDWGVYRNFAIGYRKQRSGVVVLTNSFHGMDAYERLVNTATGGSHPSIQWVRDY